ncbi:MAG: sulfite exporter TauE/SafE family protein [Clostridia bacterium]|nr:sulfite exporter TauE/SafE family protein [Clostridia bacterium]
MLKIILLAVSGIAAGVLGGMGMGGGTILIPLLTIFFNVGQKEAQAINLVAFIPMAIVSLAIHIKNKRVKKEGLLWIIVPAVLTSVGGGFAAQAVNGEVLKRIFGGFLLLLSVVQFFSEEITEFLARH